MRFTLTQTVLAATLGLGLAAAPAMAQDKSNAGATDKGMDRATTAAGDHGKAGRDKAAEAMAKKDEKGKHDKASKDMKEAKDMKDKAEKMDKKSH